MPKFCRAVAKPYAVPTNFSSTTSGTHGQITAPYTLKPMPVRIYREYIRTFSPASGGLDAGKTMNPMLAAQNAKDESVSSIGRRPNLSTNKPRKGDSTAEVRL